MHSQTWANSALGLERKGRKEEGGQEGVLGKSSHVLVLLSLQFETPPTLLASICQGETVSSKSPNPTVQSLASLRLSLGLKDLHYAFRGKDGKKPTCQCRRCKRLGFPGLGRSPGRGHGNPLQYSCLENLMDRGAWRAIVHWVSKSRTWLKRLSIKGKPTTSGDAQPKWRQFLPGLGEKCLY